VSSKPARRVAQPPARSGGRWVWATVIAVLLAAGGAAIALAAGGNDSATAKQHEISARVTVSGSALPAAGEGGFKATADPALGNAAPTLTGQTFSGHKITFGNDGKPRVVLFVFHGCPHCQAEVPRLVALAKQGKLDGVDVQTVTTGTDPRYDNYPPSSWLQREDWPYPVLTDDAQNSAASAYGLQFYPYFVFVDANGNVVGRASGEASDSAITSAFRALANGDPAPLAA
jgi:cytochrome oxidase Cu insertion factor (SCO1/SenC/PrrC family)